jgi:hypothetical protein
MFTFSFAKITNYGFNAYWLRDNAIFVWLALREQHKVPIQNTTFQPYIKSNFETSKTALLAW